MQKSYPEYDPNHSDFIPWPQLSIHTLLQCSIQPLFPVLLVFIQPKITSARLSSIYNATPPLPSHLSPDPSAHFYPQLSFVYCNHHWNNTHPSLCLSALTPCGDKPSIYLVSPCFAITSPLRNPPILHLSIHLPMDALRSSPIPSLQSRWTDSAAGDHQLSQLSCAYIFTSHATTYSTISLDVIWHNVIYLQYNETECKYIDLLCIFHSCYTDI